MGKEEDKEIRKETRRKLNDEWDRAIDAFAKLHPNWNPNAIRHMRKGQLCLTCYQRVQMYRQPLHNKMMAVLAYMYGFTMKYRPKGAWIHVNEEALQVKLNVTNRQFCKLQFWDLIEERTMTAAESSIKRNAGYWRVTNTGAQFLKKGLRIPAAVYLFNGKKYYMSDDEPIGPNPHVNYATLIMNEPNLKFRFDLLMRGEWGAFRQEADKDQNE